jgi:argininosuccinate synthase
MPRYAELIYNGFWFAPEREMLQALIDKSQEHVTGTVRSSSTRAMSSLLASAASSKTEVALRSERLVTFEDDAGAYDQKDAEGFIRLNALRLRGSLAPWSLASGSLP